MKSEDNAEHIIIKIEIHNYSDYVIIIMNI